MRKKLFAVIMSAMMMITFMPAMAFADITVVTPTTPTDNTLSISDVTTWTPGPAPAGAEFVYDGKEHTVSLNKLAKMTVDTGTEMTVEWDNVHWKWVVKQQGINPKEFSTVDATVQYNVKYDDKEEGTTPKWTGWSTTAPVIKNAGWYDVKVLMTVVDAETGKTITLLDDSASIEILKREVAIVEPAGVLVQTKVYDGKGFTLTDADFTITSDLNGNGKVDDNEKNAGMVTGDTLFTAINATKADAGEYAVAWSALKTNTNYYVVNKAQLDKKAFKLVIEKADPEVKITSNELKIKRGKNAKVKYSTNFGTAKLTKTSGNAKITLKNGKLYVKKSLKKGTYKVTLKASVAKDTNWNAAKRVKTLKIVVK